MKLSKVLFVILFIILNIYINAQSNVELIKQKIIGRESKVCKF